MPSTVGSSVRAALRAGMTTIDLGARPCRRARLARRLDAVSQHGGRGSVSCARHADVPLPPEIFKAYDIRGLYGERDRRRRRRADRPRVRARARDLAGKPTGELRVGLGRDMRLTAPELAARYRDGLVAEGAHVLDAGMVGHRDALLARRLARARRRADVHRLAQPEGLHGREARRARGARAVAATRASRTSAALIEDGLPRRAPGGGSRRGGRHLRRVPGRGARGSSTRRDQAAEGRGRRRQRHGRADGRPAARAARGLDLVPTYWEPDGEFPDHEPNPLLPENRAFIIDKVRDEGADLGIAWDGDADRCFFIDDTGGSSTATSSPRCSPSRCSRSARAPTILYDVRASRRRAPTPSRPPAARALVNRVGHAFFKTRMRDEGGVFGGEVSGHYYFRDFYNADSGTIPALLILELLGQERREADRAARALPLEVLHLRRDQLRGRRPGRRRWPRSSERYADARSAELDGVSVDYDDWHFNVRPSNTEPLLRLSLESLVSQRGHGAPARRGARPDPLVIDGGRPLPADPDAVRGRARQLLPDRGRPADAGRHRAELGQGARRARARAARARARGRGPRADRRHPPAHRPPRPGRHPRPPLGRRGLRARPARAR